MPFTLFQNRRKKLLAEPMPAEWIPYLQRNVWHYHTLSEGERASLHDILRVIIDEKNWEGCKGLVMTPEIQVTIAAQAAILLLGTPHDYFANVEAILVYPYDYVAMEQTVGPGRVVSETPSYRLGEAWSQGPVIVSWPEALTGGRIGGDGRNVVLHEFAHKLDYRDGRADGVPKLSGREAQERWSEVMSAEFQFLVNAAHDGVPTLLNQYGATNPAEFFAVATECFFEQPREMRHFHPQLYKIFQDFYGQDPAVRVEAMLRAHGQL
ncbi:MAG: mtfA [Capsulimonas sp.]|jgi:Mlc titration factor MtfA (ptsG expression regulator)|nr:mtfA [Capsulimonas sp.]